MSANNLPTESFAGRFGRGFLIVIGFVFVGFSFGWPGAVLGIAAGIAVARWDTKRRQAQRREQSDGLSTGAKAALGVASFAFLIGKALEDLDDLPQSTTGNGSGGVRAVRSWHDGDGRHVEVASDGRLYYGGRFVGHRDASGKVVGGDGNLIGTLKDSGEFYGADGQAKGRLFS